MAKLEPDIADANRRIAAHARQDARTAERRQLLANTLVQWRRYSDVVLHLDPYNPEHLPMMATILRAVGARVALTKDAAGNPDIDVTLTITAAAAQPWFTDDAPATVIPITDSSPSMIGFTSNTS